MQSHSTLNSFSYSLFHLIILIYPYYYYLISYYYSIHSSILSTSINFIEFSIVLIILTSFTHSFLVSNAISLFLLLSSYYYLNPSFYSNPFSISSSVIYFFNSLLIHPLYLFLINSLLLLFISFLRLFHLFLWDSVNGLRFPHCF